MKENEAMQSISEEKILNWEEKRAKHVKHEVLSLVHEQSSREWVLSLYEKIYPLLLRSRHGNPVHHTPQVLHFIVQIGLGDRRNDREMRILMAAALLHDAGFSRMDPGHRKIRSSDLEMIHDPKVRNEKKQEAIALRLEHAKRGAEIAAEILPGYLDAECVEQVCRIVRKHDDPSVAELEEGAEKKKWLFAKEEFLLWTHREADRLWMLTMDGILSDLMADMRKGKKGTPEEKLAHNLKRHRQERALYDIFPEAGEEFGFSPECAFFRSETGKNIFRSLSKK